MFGLYLSEVCDCLSEMQHYSQVGKHLDYIHKKMVADAHRVKWDVGDWTDESDQMILIMQSLIDNNGKVSI